ncbi:hypothetical protein CRUP_033970 [Coryphaenoides rupestris]|nr:hypothetical protein CRUP_033970 [Coryphaenoides rupestris]
MGSVEWGDAWKTFWKQGVRAAQPPVSVSNEGRRNRIGRFMRKSEPPGFWPRLGYLAFSLASSDLMGLPFFSWES